MFVGLIPNTLECFINKFFRVIDGNNNADKRIFHGCMVQHFYEMHADI